MSRHELEGTAPGSRVVVGWDQPMMTYFVHVFTAGARREGPSIWIGDSYAALYELEDLKRAVRPYAELPVELAGTLNADRDEGR